MLTVTVDVVTERMRIRYKNGYLRASLLLTTLSVLRRTFLRSVLQSLTKYRIEPGNFAMDLIR